MNALARWSLLLLVLTPLPTLAQPEQSLNTPFYPLQVGNKWTYRMDKQKVIIEVVSKEPVTITVTKDKKEIKEKVASYVLKLSSGDKVQTEQVAVLADGVYRYQAAGKKIEPPLKFFKLPLNQGDSWDVASTSEETQIKGTMKAGEAKVKVPAGTYQAMTVSGKFPQGDTGKTMELQYWFAEQIGMVRQTVTIGGREITLELERFEPANQ